MAEFRNAMKSLANSTVNEEELKAAVDIAEMRNIGVVFPYMTSSAPKVFLKDSFGNTNFRDFQRSYKSMNFTSQEYKQESVKHKKFRKVLRNRLVDHIMDIPSLQNDGDVSLSLLVKLCHSYLECFNNEELDVIDAKDILESVSVAGGQTRFRLISTELQCNGNECNLLRILMMCGATVKTARTLNGLLKVSGDFPFEYKRNGKVSRLSSQIDLNFPDLSASVWHPISKPIAVTHVINSDPNDDSRRVCDITFETRVDKTIPIGNESSNTAVQLETSKIVDVLKTAEWELSSKGIQCNYSGNPGFNTIVVCTRRNSYELQAKDVDFSLMIENKSYFRFDKDDGMLHLRCRATSVPLLIFPFSPSVTEESKIAILNIISLLADRFMDLSQDASLELNPCNFRFRIGANDVSGEIVTALRRLAFGNDFHEILGLSLNASPALIYRKINQLRRLVSTYCSDLAKMNSSFDPKVLIEKLTLLESSNC